MDLNWNIGYSWVLSLPTYTISSPNSPASQVQILGFLSLQSHVSQLLIICLYIYLSPFLFSSLPSSLLPSFWSWRTQLSYHLRRPKLSAFHSVSLSYYPILFVISIISLFLFICLYDYLCISPPLKSKWNERIGLCPANRYAPNKWHNTWHIVEPQ